MTREEAVANLNMISVAFVEPVTKEQRKIIDDTFDMAIKSLEQEPILDKIKAEIEALIDWHDCPIEYDNGNDVWYCEACNQSIKIIDKYRGES